MEDSFLSPRQMRTGGGLVLNVSDPKNESYLFTSSGAIQVDGFGPAIRATGIVASSSSAVPAADAALSGDAGRLATPLPLSDRIVMLNKLGAGASGTVYVMTTPHHTASCTSLPRL